MCRKVGTDQPSGYQLEREMREERLHRPTQNELRDPAATLRKPIAHTQAKFSWISPNPTRLNHLRARSRCRCLCSTHPTTPNVPLPQTPNPSPPLRLRCDGRPRPAHHKLPRPRLPPIPPNYHAKQPSPSSNDATPVRPTVLVHWTVAHCFDPDFRSARWRYPRPGPSAERRHAARR